MFVSVYLCVILEFNGALENMPSKDFIFVIIHGDKEFLAAAVCAVLKKFLLDEYVICFILRSSNSIFFPKVKAPTEYLYICNKTLQAEKEPILSSFLYASILSHDCLEQALAFVLANRLQNPTLLATQLLDTISNVIMKDRGIQHSIRLDMQVTYQIL